MSHLISAFNSQESYEGIRGEFSIYVFPLMGMCSLLHQSLYLFSPDARIVATFTRNKKVRKPKNLLKRSKDRYCVVRLYALQSFSPIGDLPLRDLVSGGFVASECQWMSFSPDGSFLALGESDGKLFVWNVNTQQLVASMQAHPYFEGALPYNSIEAVNWSKRGHLLAIGGRDPTDAVTHGEEFVIKLWDVSTLYED